MSITLSMVVKNEGERYLRRALLHHKPFIDAAVIIDDASTDNTITVCKEVLSDIPLKIVENKESRFVNEITLRKQQWNETIKTNPSWILNLDSDELLESSFLTQLEIITNQQMYDAVYFRLYDMWSNTHYRDDQYWYAHKTYRPFLVRFKPTDNYVWKETAQHCGRFPLTIAQYHHFYSTVKIQHFGWSTEKDRKEKYERYMKLDSKGIFGCLEQYQSILDSNPNLIKWSGNSDYN
ncbi:glycosyltransferase family 2 protein [Lysinibacillus sp. Bpr_S20]|uniref:glycosyltransferase family 2 protein n=1 Tax=Lysinibacillus sp. Bpr_S20 TaxID=2933964 RepID=UPI002012DB6B|nr:glycosyltransferase family 2 protein [Lysinibacillus sp. Bpr_S20]MCL1702454.1 glycosyltransferase family 2 protein [Lysinibacillus sp. Bpr_S20]